MKKRKNGVLQIKSFAEACEYLGISSEILEFLKNDTQLRAWYQLRTIIQAVNKGKEMNLLRGSVYYPIVRIISSNTYDRYRDSEEELLAIFPYEDKTFYLTGGYDAGTSDGLTFFSSYAGIGANYPDYSFLGSPSTDAARYIGKTFGALLWDAHYAHHLDFSLTDEDGNLKEEYKPTNVN